MHIAMQNRLIRVVQLAQIVAQRALLCQTQQMSRVFSKPFRFRSITRYSVPYAGDVRSIALRRAVVLCAVRQIPNLDNPAPPFGSMQPAPIRF